ncbi:hypothetical protein [Microlunatus sp. Y2014]|uniref:hypothetical protein n=1 Tax=Microlunatus sp. Y2014 TaxID=3418488 RepID=UPI003DA73BB4
METGTGWSFFATPNVVGAERVGTDSVVLDVNRFDPATQVLEENHLTIGVDGIRPGPIVQRLAPPPELDLMARLAGLQLSERFGWWDRRAFDAGCDAHVSIYRRS